VKPLEGIRVLDLSRVLAGPWATQSLADLGAEVIKVEQPGSGDDTRHWGPPWHVYGCEEGLDGERVAAYFLAANRGKKSVTIDFSTAEGAALVRAMAADCDVLVENFKVGGLAKFGLDAATLRAANPRLIYASISGFGQDGPDARRAGYD
jgi:formyl-CoA transferase